MMFKKKNINKIFILFLLSHAIIWTSIPSFTNINLPLDTIEALAWGSNLDWGFLKHPPFSAFAVEIFYQIFGNQDWAFYFLSQICVIVAFIYVWKFSNRILINKTYSLISVLLLEGIYYFNFTTPEFNVNVCQLPFWSLTVYYAWESINGKKIKNWILFGTFAAFGFLSKYLFLYLILSIAIFFVYLIKKNKSFDKIYLLPILIFSVFLTPHLIWLYENSFQTIFYAINRTGLENSNLMDHITNPIIFILKQLIILIPFFLLLFTVIQKIKIDFIVKEKKAIFLIIINILPLILILFTSLISGAKIRTMWLTPFYLFLGTMFIYFFRKNLNLKKMKKFLFLFLFLFILSPSLYLYVSLSKDNKRTDYPGSEIAYLVQQKWNKNFSNEIAVIIGDEWSGGNLSYHLSSRPKWLNTLDDNLADINPNDGFIYIGNPDILKKICPGVFGTIKPVGICMIGRK